MVKQLLLAQHGVDRLCHGGTLARPQAAVVAEKTGHNGVSRVVKFKSEPDQFGAGIQQGFWVHNRVLSHEHR